MAIIRSIDAVLFDMDGTLIDSEAYTGPVIQAVCSEQGLEAPMLNWAMLAGITWEETARLVCCSAPQLTVIDDFGTRLHHAFHRMCADRPPPEIGAARQAVRAAHAHCRTAIVSSSHRETIAGTIARLELADALDTYVGGEDCERSKPAPDAFLRAADILKVDPAQCLVFEDSMAGLEAARAAGMRVIAVLHRAGDPDGARVMADRAIVDYSELEDDFFRTVAAAT